MRYTRCCLPSVRSTVAVQMGLTMGVAMTVYWCVVHILGVITSCVFTYVACRDLLIRAKQSSTESLL